MRIYFVRCRKMGIHTVSDRKGDIQNNMATAATFGHSRCCKVYEVTACREMKKPHHPRGKGGAR